ncbi:histidine decarboxylase [Streptomyces sp. NBC_01174]|uniref:histidine decarboxylase n=1 Tax=Streptomyces sp. NBC_01174 TaxID=2903758 RepID=UPI003867AC42|nr:histidine decarboxylase [Streptomyces sp. NBC_01177]WSS74470.1 histidine decarboxylase [Streptomyces sp. NBC_01174]
MRIYLDHELAISDASRSADEVEADIELLQHLAFGMREARFRSVGAPVNLDFDYGRLAPLLAVHANNAGSPCGTSEYRLHTKSFERAVVEFFVQLAGATSKHTFGYVTNGGTDSNLFGVFVGRERHPDAVLYASEDVHYSVPKIARLLRMDYVPVETDRDGSMLLPALADACRQRGGSAVVVVTVGSTGKGAIDDLPGVRRALAEAGIERTHVHVDAAFGGLLAALAPRPRPWAFPDGADSIAISGHKMVGCPIPCGVVLANSAHVEAIRVPGAAIGADDDTISGSRDALSPLLLWHELRRLGRQGLTDRVHDCLRLADYATQRLSECDRNPSHLPGTNTVLFDAPSQELCARWHLFQQGDRAHMVTMPHVTEELIDQLCADLASEATP